MKIIVYCDNFLALNRAANTEKQNQSQLRLSEKAQQPLLFDRDLRVPYYYSPERISRSKGSRRTFKERWDEEQSTEQATEQSFGGDLTIFSDF